VGALANDKFIKNADGSINNFGNKFKGVILHIVPTTKENLELQQKYCALLDKILPIDKAKS
jgi:hypothetical protein